MTKPSDTFWNALRHEHHALSAVGIAELFTGDRQRAEDFSIEAAGLFLDYSKNRLSRQARHLLLELAAAQSLLEKRADLFGGVHINSTEDRPVLHTALRDRSGRVVSVGNEDACELARIERERMLAFVDTVHNGQCRGSTGKELTTVVNIGIGGSDLGPQMAVEALRPYWLEGRKTYFVSNVDGQQLADTLQELDVETTLFIIASKTFTTQETMTNARSAVNWFLGQGRDRSAVASHFVALSTNTAAVAEFGIPAASSFGFWDWVGGRYSLWSSIGLSIALQTGSNNFLALLDGAFVMDEHFRSAPLSQNMPVLLALVGIWNRNLEDIGVHAVLPYDQHLHRLPAYLQQADMESNGKRVLLDGSLSERATGPVIFGEPGTNGQHAFYQLLHQGTERISADFIAAAHSQTELGDHHPKLLANLLAQPRALMTGKSTEDARRELIAAGETAESVQALAPHKTFPGNRPSNVILMTRLSPATLGALIALYEHKIFCQGVIWGINSFDQWGVELGKQLAAELLPFFDDSAEDFESRFDPSTEQLLKWLKQKRRLARGD